MICKKCGREIENDSAFCRFCGQNQKKPVRKRRFIRRENGTGSVYKRADLKARPWVATGPKLKKAKRPIIGYFQTAQEAKDAVEKYRIAPTTKLNITLKQLYDEWQPIGTAGKSRQLKDSYHAAWNKLKPLYDKKFREIRTAQMQDIIDYYQRERPALDKEGKPVIKNKKAQILKPMSYSALHDVKTLLGVLYKYAMQNDIVNKNYAQFLVLPKKPTGVKDCFNDLELKKIENAAFGNGVDKIPFADCILFMCYTGLRITEFITLKKESVYHKDSLYALYGGIKTDAGKDRIVPVHHKILPILKGWLEKNGRTIFCRPDGSPYTANYFRKNCYYPALEQIGVRRLTPHATRRRMATSMSEADIREEDFIAMMGHADFKIDVESYIFQTAEKLSKSIEKME